MSLPRERIELIKENKQLRKDRDKWKLDYAVLDEKHAALEQTLQETQEKLDKLYRDGALGYIENDNGFIIKLSIIDPYANRTFIQEKIGTYTLNDIMKLTQTKAYQLYPFLQEEKGIIGINSEEYKKYKGVITI